jgi:hypothetical protein
MERKFDLKFTLTLFVKLVKISIQLPYLCFSLMNLINTWKKNTYNKTDLNYTCTENTHDKIDRLNYFNLSLTLAVKQKMLKLLNFVIYLQIWLKLGQKTYDKPTCWIILRWPLPSSSNYWNFLELLWNLKSICYNFV